MFQLINRLRMARALGRLIEDPEQTEQVFKLSRLGRRAKDQAPIQALLSYVSKHDDFLKLYHEPYRPTMPTLKDLTAHPPGSLGSAYHDHLVKNSLQPDFFPPESDLSLLSYTIQRARQTHDIWHVLTGFDTSVPGEVALQAFTLTQIHASISAALLFGGMMHITLHKPAEIDPAIDLLVDGLQRGRRANFLLAIRWEELFHLPLTEARKLAGL